MVATVGLLLLPRGITTHRLKLGFYITISALRLFIYSLLFFAIIAYTSIFNSPARGWDNRGMMMANITKILERHIELLESVNNAKTYQEHHDAETRLNGYRDAMQDYGLFGFLMDADRHYLDQGIDRPMCCGVFLDWKPE